MRDELPNLSELEERHDGFAYGYRMRCDCGGISPISAAIYGIERTREAMMDCNDCGVSFNFGPAVAAIRDPEDPALDNGRIGRMAWYHTSTAADWPSSTYADDLRPALEEAADRFRFLDREHSVERHLRKALHVGTYEAAIENMLRRMDDQADADSTFYLHRVALNLDPRRINAGYRDESDEAAAQITTDDLRRDGLDAVRYLNVHEAIGSLSLAVLPETISAVQTIKLPVEGIGMPADQSLADQIDAFEARLAGLQSLEPSTDGVPARELRLMQLGLRPDPEGIGRASEEHTHSIYDLWRDLEQVLTAQYLAEVSPVVADDFRDALADWRRVTDAGVQAFARQFAAMAALLTHSMEVRRAVAAAPVRRSPRSGGIPGATPAREPMSLDTLGQETEERAMAGEIELVSDADGVVVTGSRSTVERFLVHAGLLEHTQEFGLGKLGSILRTGSDVAKTASGIMEQSALYLKLTPEYAQRLKDAGGLMKTKTEGISYAMLGETGKKSLKWLQVEDGPASLLTNPAVLSGIGGLMSQFAQQTEAQALKALLVRIDEKLDDVRRTQRDDVLAQMRSAGAAIEEAMTIREHGGDPNTLWDKMSGVSTSILDVEEKALLALGALSDKVEGKRKTGQLKKAAQEIERDVATQLAILARCFELQDEFRVVELDHVFATAPSKLDGHRRGVVEARKKRRANVLEQTGRIMAQMDAAGGIANEHVILHARAAGSVVDSLNSTAALVDEFHAPLGIESSREELSRVPWREAVRDRDQLKTAGQEAATGAVVGIGAVVMGAKFVARNGSKPGA